MKLIDIEQLAAEVKTVTAGARATGPRTEKGKIRSALNAVRHGLAGKQLLLPGEDTSEYERRMDGTFIALDPKDEAQAQVVALIADDLWKLDRLGKIERGITLGRIEELLALTSSNEKAGATTNALAALGSALTRWAQQPIPTEHTTELSRRLQVLREALDLVSAVMPEIPADLVEACDPFLLQLRRESGTVSVAAYNGAYQAAHVVMALLLKHGDRVCAAQEELRCSVATIALPDKSELAKIAKYRTMLELSLQRRLEALDQLRKLAPAVAPSAQDAERAREYRVKLRVVG